MDQTNPAGLATQPTLENPPPVMAKVAPSAIQGIDNIVANPDAIGQLPDNTSAPSGTQQSVQQPQQPVLPNELPVEEMLKSNPALQKYVEAERSRAVNGARQKWDTDILGKKLEADAKQREEALQELSRRALSNDQDAILELGKNTAAQVMQKLTQEAMLSAYANQFLAESDNGLKKVFGDNVDPTLRLNNFNSMTDWIEAVAKAKEAQLNSDLTTTRANEIEKLAEAKAIDIMNQRRNLLPSPDLTSPVGGGGSGTPRKWNTLSEAATLFANDEISAQEYAVATQWYAENRIKFQDTEFGSN